MTLRSAPGHFVFILFIFFGKNVLGSGGDLYKIMTFNPWLIRQNILSSILDENTDMYVSLDSVSLYISLQSSLRTFSPLILYSINCHFMSAIFRLSLHVFMANIYNLNKQHY